MSDFNSSLPVRTENAGDIIAKIADATVPSQQLAVDAAGKIEVKLDDASGNGITSQASGGQQALDVGINVGGAQVDPRAIRPLTSGDVVTADQGGTWTVQQGATPTSIANAWPVLPTDGTNSQSYTASGEAKVDITQPLPAGTNAIGTVNASNLPTTVDTNYGAVGSSTLRSASQVGNASGAADFNNGATGAQTLRTAANLAVAGANVTALNPVPVSIVSTTVGTPINKYNTSSAVAAAGSVNHDYAITAGKTFSGRKFWASASGKLKAEVQTSPDGVTFTTFWVGFNSSANPNIDIDLGNLVITDTGSGSKMRIIMTNKDNQSEDVYSTISGTEA